MSRILLRKRKGKWVAVSASILASTSIVTLATGVANAEEVPASDPYAQTYSENNELGQAPTSQSDAVLAEQPVANDAAYIEETAPVVEETVTEDVMVETPVADQAPVEPVIEEAPVAEELVEAPVKEATEEVAEVPLTEDETSPAETAEAEQVVESPEAPETVDTTETTEVSETNQTDESPEAVTETPVDELPAEKEASEQSSEESAETELPAETSVTEETEPVESEAPATDQPVETPEVAPGEDLAPEETLAESTQPPVEETVGVAAPELTAEEDLTEEVTPETDLLAEETAELPAESDEVVTESPVEAELPPSEVIDQEAAEEELVLAEETESTDELTDEESDLTEEDLASEEESVVSEETDESEETEETTETDESEEVSEEESAETEETEESTSESETDETTETDESEETEEETTESEETDESTDESEEAESVESEETTESEIAEEQAPTARIATYSAPAEVEPETKEYAVNSGDTLYSIAQRNNVTVEQLKDWNNLSSNIIHPNTNIIVAQTNNTATTSTDDRRRYETATKANGSTTSTNVKSNTVKSGDTLYSIAKRNNVTVAQLKDWNNLSSNTIMPNQQLVVSEAESGSNNSATADTYRVTGGDTLYSIARRNNVTVSQLKDWNNLTSNTILVNQNIVVSQGTSGSNDGGSQATESHTVSSGDTLWSIAQRNNVTVAQLRDWNNLSGTTILANQSLIVSNPDGSSNGGSNETSPSQETQTSYTVGRGDTLYSIAQRNNVTVDQIRDWNNLDSNTIYNNQNLIVSDGTPVAGGDTAEDVIVDADSEGRQAVIDWFQAREGKTTYSMTNRNGPYSYDCSSAVFSALIDAGYLPEGTWLGNTETLFGLEGSLLIPIERQSVTAGDIFVNGVKGHSLGSGGHTGVALSNSSIIHSNYSDNGISTTPIEGGYTGSGPTHWYRLNDAFLNN